MHNPFPDSFHPFQWAKGGSAGRRPKPQPIPIPEEDSATAEQERANTPRAEDEGAKPKARLTKIGWVSPETFFESEAECFAEFDVPAALGDRSLVEF